MRIALSTLLVLALALTAHAERITVDPPLKLLTHKKDKSQVAGDIVAYDDDGFDLRDFKNQTTTVAWKDLEAKNFYQIHERLYTEASGEQWLALAQQLIAMPDGKPFAERALVKAIKLDPDIKEKVEQAARTIATKAPTTAAAATAEPNVIDVPRDFPVSDSGAQKDDSTVKNPWPKLTEPQLAAAVKESIVFAEQARKKVNGSLALYETKYFLFYSDLPPSEAGRWSGVLDQMYARLGELFAVPKGANIWKGKALIFVFTKAEDYRKFEEEMNHFSAGGTAGMFAGREDGLVNIAFYRQPDAMAFAHVLVHEAVHGFIFRYRSKEDIPNWVNEGLAEVIATELVPRRSRAQAASVAAVNAIRQHNGLGNFMSAGNIQSWQYPVAQSLCEFMIRQNKSGYVAFINAIKDGMSANNALEKKYGATKARLISAYAESLGLKGITAE